MTKKVLFSTRLKQLVAVIFLLTASVVNAQAPTITSFSPASGAVGSSVTITGTNFDATPANNIVYFGSVKATVTAATTTSLTVTVPKSSVYGPITVISNSLLVKSNEFFRVINNPIAPNTITDDKFGSNIGISSTPGYNFSFKDMYIAVGDFDNDSKVDVVKGGNGLVKVHRNLISTPSTISSSSFSAGNDFAVTGQPSSIIIDDINADGKLDIITGSSAGVSVLINNSTGTGSISFASAVNLAGSYADVLRVSDFDSDGKLDLVTIRSATVAIYRNISTSGFALAAAQIVNIPTLTSCQGLGVGDFNKDSKPDIVVSNSSSTAILLNGSSVANITFPNSLILTGGGSSIVVGDFDNEGDPDIYLTNRIFVNNFSSGSISSSNFSTFTYNIDGGASAYSISDFNGDGNLEINGGTTWDACYTMIINTLPISNSSLSGIGYFLSKTYAYTAGVGLGVDVDGDDKVDYISAANYYDIFSVTQNLMTPQPSISINSSISPFNNCDGTASVSQAISVNGSNLTANISVAALTGYEYSTDGNTWASTLSLTQSSGTVSSTVYVRMTAASTGSPSGNIVFSSTGATTRSVAVSGSVGTNNVFIGALSFDGVNDKVTVADNNALDLTNNYTLEAWIYPKAFPWLGGIISKYHSNSANGYHLRLSPYGNSRGLSFDEMNTADNILTANTWYHVAAVNNNGTRKLYVNGVEVALTGTPTSVVANSDPLIIGRDFDAGGGRFFQGDIDEVRLWNFAKTQAQVVAQKDISLTGSESNLVLYYNFNQGTPGGNNISITTVSNLASGSYTGTLNGFDRTSTTSNFVTSTNAPVIGGGSSLCLGSPLQLTHSVSGGTWSIPTTTGLAISNSGELTGTTSTTATSVVVSYLYTYNGCQFTDTKTITIGQLTAGTATGNQTLCSTVAPTAITLAGNSSGSTIQWQSSLDNTTFSNISNATAASLSPGSLSSTTYYRAAVTTAACGTLYSNVITKGYNNSLSFDGTDDYVQAGAPLPIAANDNFTYEAWVRPSVIDANYRGFLGTHVANVGRAPSMWVGPSGSLHTDSYSGSTRYDMLVNNFFTENTWVHVAWVKNGNAYTIYKNGVQVATATAPSSVLLPNANFTIGKLDNFFAGTLDEVRIWNTARTAQEISDNMSATLNGNETGLRAYYTFNQGTPEGTNSSINTVANLTATANLNGTLTGFAKTGATSNFVGGFRAVIATQPVAPTVVCLNASSNTISVTAYGSGITYQWYTNSVNSTTGATAIANATTNSYVIPTNVAGTKYYYVVVTGTCGSAITSTIVAQVINNSTFTTDVSGAAQDIAYGGTATALTVASPGATAYQWYSTPTKPTILDGFSGGTGWSSSTGGLQAFALYSGASPAIDSNGYLRFAYTSPSYIYKEFNLDQTATTITFSTEYASLDNNNDRGKIQLYFYNASNTQVGSVVESATLTGSSAWQSIALNNTAIPTGATKVRVVFYQIQEYPYWAGNYGIAFRNPSVTTNVALNGTAITGATSATYTPSTSTPGALYYYAVATGGCSTATSALSGLITVGKATPTIASMAAINKTFGDAAFTLTAPTSNATGAFTFTSSNPAVATISGTTVTIVGAGTATITATQATDANYNPASVTAVLTVAKATPTLSSFADINKTTTDAPFTLVAPISSGGTGAITYASSNTAVATVSGSNVTITGIGTSIITATQAADANYLAATITATLTVILGDSDGDGVPDDVEIREGTDPNNPSSVKDSDGDGVPDYVEIGSGTNPNNPADAIDSDGDGLSDYYEARNAAPTNIALSATTINENNTAGAAIVDIAATDVNIGEVFTYTLVSGTGDTDNASFSIVGNELKVGIAFDYETKSSYSIRVKTTDAGGLSFEKAFTITVTNVNETPILSVSQTTNLGVVGIPLTTITVTNTSGPATSFGITPALSAGLTFNTTTGAISGTPTVAIASRTYTISGTNSDGTGTVSLTLFIDQDTDRDGLLDSIDTDDDGDGILDRNDAFPLNKDEWTDTDRDGIGNNADTDDDNDSILDACDVDANGDGIPDNGTDLDSDGINDGCDTDKDGDGVNNTSDNCPNLPNTDQADRDRDGLGDSCDTVELDVMQALTPNGDGINDTWVIYNLGNHPGSIVRVFNSNGTQVFYSANYQNNWTGHYEGRNEMLPVGSYLYQIDLGGDGSIDSQGWLYITK